MYVTSEKQIHISWKYKLEELLFVNIFCSSQLEASLFCEGLMSGMHILFQFLDCMIYLTARFSSTAISSCISLAFRAAASAKSVPLPA